MLRQITSPQNPAFKSALKAKKNPSRKNFFIEGPNLIEMALASGAEIRRAFLTDGFLKNTKKGAHLLRLLMEKHPELYGISDALFKKLSDTGAPQGIAAEVAASSEELALNELSLKTPALLVVSDAVREPGNLGALIRAADAAGADAVILLPGSCSPLNPKALRASAGSFFNLPVIHAEPKTLFGWLKRKAIRLLGAEAHAGVSLYDVDLRAPVAFAFGEETHGLSAAVRENADILVGIPLRGGAESLNVAQSGALFLFEALRRRGVFFTSAV